MAGRVSLPSSRTSVGSKAEVPGFESRRGPLQALAASGQLAELDVVDAFRRKIVPSFEFGAERRRSELERATVFANGEPLPLSELVTTALGTELCTIVRGSGSTVASSSPRCFRRSKEPRGCHYSEQLGVDQHEQVWTEGAAQRLCVGSGWGHRSVIDLAGAHDSARVVAGPPVCRTARCKTGPPAQRQAIAVTDHGPMIGEISIDLRLSSLSILTKDAGDRST